MSYEPHYARILDTRLESSDGNKVCYVLKEGSQTTSFVPLVSSSHSNSNTNFNLNNIATNTCRDSRLALGITVSATLNISNTTAAAITPITGDNFGFKQYPLNRSMSSVQHQINQASYTLNTNDIIDAMARLNLLPDDCNFYNNSMPDFIDSYAAATGSAFNPLESYSATIAGDGIYKPRSMGFDISGGDTIAAGASGVITIMATLYEPLITPFCNISADDSRGLFSITGELLQISWVNDLFNNMFAYAMPAGLTMNSSAVSLGSAARLFCIYLTPKENTIAQIPSQSVYQYNDYTIFSNNIAGSVLAGQPLTSVNSQCVNFTGIPSKILVYARESNGTRNCSTPDKYLALQALTVQWDNGSPQFAGATPDQLYDISRRNQLQMPRDCWKQSLLNRGVEVDGGLYGCGSMFVIDPSLDLGINFKNAVGSGGRFIFQVQNATFANLTETDFGSITLYVVGINSAVLERTGSEYRNRLLSTPDDAINQIKDLPPVSYKQYLAAAHSNLFLMGGGIGDWFKKAHSMGTRAFNWAKNHRDDMEGVIQAGQDIYQSGKKLLGRGARSNRLFLGYK